jgi:hypothetical protein
MIVRRDKIPDVAAAFLLYIAITIAMTWPLAAGLARDVPGDLGDALLNMWILGWGAETLPRVLTGSMSLADVWNANIFHPEPLALSFSEHLFGQVLQILPIYRLSGNLILCYNLLFLSTFVLSGIGMYLLVKEFTGNRYAAFIAGLLFAFVPYRVAQVAHIQSLSSQWMPLALYGFRRYIITSRTRALAGGAAALLIQNWSCGYYLIFFSPLVVLFVVHQLVAAGRGGDGRAWLMFLAAGLAVAAGTWPFLAMYLEAQRVHGFERPLAEIVGFSADVFGYVTAPEALKLLGATLRAWPRPEGELFLGFVPTVLAAVAVYATMRQARGNTTSGGALSEIVTPPRRLSLRRAAALIFGTVALALAAAAAVAIATGGFVTSIGGVPLRATNVTRLLSQLALVTAVLILLSRRFRCAIAHLIASSTGIACVSLVLALWLSLGPVPHARGQAIDVIGLYGVFLDHVPGFGSLRVPARYAMIAAVYLSLLGGIGAAWLFGAARGGRAARPLAIAVAIVFLVEAAFAPLLVNQTWGEDGMIPPPRVEPASSAPAVYQRLRLAGDAVVAEFPFGDPAWELRYVYYSTVHWKRLVNGYSGGFPQGYKMRVARLQRVNQFPIEAWQTLIDADTTHVIVHEAALPAAEAAMLHAWLRGRGAVEIGRFATDVLYDLAYAR